MLPAALLSHLEVALWKGQEMNSTPASQTRMEASNLPRNLLQSSLPARGNKRRRALSWPEPVPKRPSLLPKPVPTPEALEPLLPEPWWDYFPPPTPPSEVASLDDEVDIDMLKSPSACPTPSQDSDSTESDTTQNTSSTSTSQKRKRYLEDGMVYVGPKDEDFERLILHPLGVVISDSPPKYAKPIDIFGLQPSTPNSRAILRMNDNQLEEIIQDFAVYERRGYDEYTLSRICYDSVVRRDRFIDTPIAGNDQNITTSVRRDKWRPEKEGPSISIGRYTYDWDIEPGTTYGVSLRMFDVERRWELQFVDCHPWLAEPENIACPYLTIEFKSRATNGRRSHARYQNAAASVLWLQQRKQIREALGCKLDDLKHFSITIFDSNYTISEARFRHGYYHVHELIHGSLTDLGGLKRYIEWNNAIHTWGLGPNASSFKEDIVILLERFRGQPNCPPALKNEWPARTTAFPADAPQKSGVV